ncbi:MAG: hypothetical protein ACNS61_14040 [Candidatus Wenzhouxiangella sp. M2_3B_020]
MAHETRNQSLDSSTLDEAVVLEKPGDDSCNIRIRPPGNGEDFAVEVSDRDVDSAYLTEQGTITGDTDLKLTLTERFVRVRVSTAGSSGTSDVLISSGGAE